MPKSKSKPVASRSIAAEIHELRAMSVPELVARYEGVYGKPPRVKHRAWLWRKVAWRIQETRFGGLSGAAMRRLDELIGELDLPLNGARAEREKLGGRRRRGDPPVGTTLSRVWKGTEIRATAVEGGWEHEGVVYHSLSAAVKAITGSHASGPAWFGLTKRRAAR